MTGPDDITTGYVPRTWQTSVHALMAGHRFTTAIVHRRGGKTVLAINTLIAGAAAAPSQRLGYFGPTLRQAKRIAWNLLKEFTADIPAMEYRESELIAVFPNGSTVSLFSGEDHDACRGLGFDGVVLDEVAQYPADAWPSSIRPTLSDRMGWALFIGTVRGRDVLFEFYQRGLDPAQPEWASALFSATDTGVLSEAELKSAQQSSVSPAHFEREYLCSFDASTDNTLIPLATATLAQKRNLRPSLRNSAKVLGVDVARFGGDKTVLVKRHGSVIFRPTILPQMDLMQTSAHVARMLDEWQPHACFIDVGGLGAGVYDALNQQGFNVTPVDFGSSALQGGYANRRAEMWDGLRQWLERSDSMIPNDPVLLSDICSPTFDFNSANKLRIEPKEKIKQRLGRSPDLGDAAALTFAGPVAVPFEPDWDSPHPYALRPDSYSAPERDYDPLESF